MLREDPHQALHGRHLHPDQSEYRCPVQASLAPPAGQGAVLQPPGPCYALTSLVNPQTEPQRCSVIACGPRSSPCAGLSSANEPGGVAACGFHQPARPSVWILCVIPTEPPRRAYLNGVWRIINVSFECSQSAVTPRRIWNNNKVGSWTFFSLGALGFYDQKSNRE